MINSARAIPSGILSFFGRHCETIKGATALFPPPQIPEDEFVFTQEVLRKAYYYADLEGQVLLSLAVCLGNSATDFLRLECDKLRNLIREFTTTETMERLFTLRFKEGLTHKDLFAKMGLEIKPMKHKKSKQLKIKPIPLSEFENEERQILPHFDLD